MRELIDAMDRLGGFLRRHPRLAVIIVFGPYLLAAWWASR